MNKLSTTCVGNYNLKDPVPKELKAFVLFESKIMLIINNINYNNNHHKIT